MSKKRIHAAPSLLTLLVVLVLGVAVAMAPARAAPLRQGVEITFTGEELLGKPASTSITINIVPDQTIEYYYEHGTSPGVYTVQAPSATATGGQPHEVLVSGLLANTRYYYRMQYRVPGNDWVVRDEHSFWTQRAPGSTFTFTIVSDSHAMYNAQYQQAIANIAGDQPDFHIDLGDTFMTDYMSNQNAVNSAYLAQRDPLYMDRVGHSAPIFLASGNHENEEGWNLDDSFSLAVASVKARKLYYPTPIQDGFYSANLDPLADLDPSTYGDQYREDYYAWEWGDALFVVFDPYQYTMTNPYGAMAGEGSDDPASGDRWNWTMGQQQFNWFKQTLQNSSAKYKFIFAHHMLGGTQNYVRGGAVPAHMFEWGGYNADGITWGFDTKRPGWGDDPIHQLLVANNVSAFFHGHDHQYAYEVRDGVVYQSVPRPSTGLDFNYYNESDPYTERVIGNSGHLRVAVAPEEATVEYVRSNTTGVSHSYTIEPGPSGPTHVLTLAADPSEGGTTNPAVGDHVYAEGAVVDITAEAAAGYTFDHWAGDCTGSDTCQVTMDADKAVTAHFVPDAGMLGDINGDDTVNSTDALIVLSCDVGMVTAQFCPMNCGDVNDDGLVNSTDALVILSYDGGMTVPYPVGGSGCPTSVTPCAGCGTGP